MKKSKLITLILSLSFMFIGASFVSAKAPLSLGSSIKLSENFRVNGIKLNSKTTLKKCNAKLGQDCEQELANLIEINNAWEATCNQGQSPGVCWFLEWALEDTGNAYNHCIDPVNYPVSKNTEIIYRRKRLIKKPDSIG